MNNIVKVSGNLKITLKDAATGNIIKVEEGPNLVLNTGLESLCHLMTGDISVPSDIELGELVNKTTRANQYLPLYGQFGTNPTTPRATDSSSYFNGTLDPNVMTPYGASDIVKAKYFYPNQNSVTIQLLLPPNKGNGTGAPEGITYKEAVLMCKETDSPPKYRWFARKTFGDIVKNSTTLIETEWTFTFLAG